MFSFILSILILGVPQGLMESLLKGKEMREQKMKEAIRVETRRAMHKYKGYPDYATYLDAHSAFFHPEVGANGFILVWVEAIIPGGKVDTTYQDTVNLKIAESIANNSTKFYLPIPPSILPDTTNPVTAVKLNKGKAMIWLRGTEPENIILWAIPRDTLKPSHPIPYKIDSSGISASRLVIEGPTRINASNNWWRYIVKVVDNNGRIVPTYGQIIDPSRINIKVIEQIPDGSARLKNVVYYEEGDSVRCGLISGKADIFLVDTLVEKLTLIATSNSGDLLPDTFEIEVIPQNQSTIILPFSFSGTYGTIGVNKTIFTVAFTPGIDGPDPNNNTSQVELKLFDIMGNTGSASISPAGPQTLTSGIASFILKDNEPDSGVIVQVIPSGTPALYPLWEERIGVGFKPAGQATLIHPFGPTTAIVGDTITLYVEAVDGFYSLDSTYTGWARIWIEGDNNESCQILEYGTGVPQNIIHIQNGIGRVWVVNSEPEQIRIGFGDAEDRYLGTIGGPEEAITISFEQPGGTATQWVLKLEGSPGNQFPTGYKVSGAVKACDNSRLVDTTFNDTAHIQITGFATPSDTNIVVQKGIGMFKFTDDSVEKIEISVTGAGLTSCIDSVSFVKSGTASALFAYSAEKILVKDTLSIAIWAMTADFSIDPSWNGVAKFTYSDPSTPSISWIGNPDSIPIINGSGRIKMLNSEVESVSVLLEYVSGNPPLIPLGLGTRLFQAKIVGEIPEFGSVGEAIDTMTFKTLDAFGSIVSYNTSQCFIRIKEENPNGSATINPLDWIQIVNGIGIVGIENTEEETVWVYYGSDDPFVRDGFFTKPIVFRRPGVEEIPTQFAFAVKAPNPFKKAVAISYQLPTTSKVALRIYDITGRLVYTLIDRKDKPGYYTVEWEGTADNHKKLASGIYFCKFESPDFVATKKLILIR